MSDQSIFPEWRSFLGSSSDKETWGVIKNVVKRSGEIAKYDRKKMCVTGLNSKNAITHYEVIEEYHDCSLVRFRLETGRTHQIRVHCAYIGHAVYGDDVYGKAVKGLQGQCLHAKKIGFIHPTTGEYMEFDSELPDYFISVLNRLKKMC